MYCIDGLKSFFLVYCDVLCVFFWRKFWNSVLGNLVMFVYDFNLSCNCLLFSISLGSGIYDVFILNYIIFIICFKVGLL